MTAKKVAAEDSINTPEQGWEFPAAPSIYQLISTISKEAGALAPEKNGGVPFAFRGVDAVVSHVSPLLRKYGVIVVPEVIEVNHGYREINPTKGVTQTELRTRFRFYAPDGSYVDAVTAGLAQDFSDRSAAQAQSVAFRVAILQTFALPTTDKEPEVIGEETQAFIQKNAAAKAPAAPKGPSVASVTADIKKLIAGGFVDAKGTVHDAVPAERINELGAEISGKPGNAWRSDVAVLQKVIEQATA